MASLSNALRSAKTLIPQVIASPLNAPGIVKRHISAQVAAVLNSLFVTSGASAGPSPQSTPAPTAGPQYSSFGPGNGNGSAPAPASWQPAAPSNGRQFTSPVYGVMGPAYSALVPNSRAGGNGVNYGVMARAPQLAPAAPPPVPSQPGVGAGVVMPDLGSVPQLQLGQNHLTNDQQHNVKYITDPNTRFQKYEVNLQSKILRRGQLLDTKQIKTHFSNKQGTNIGVAYFGHSLADCNARFTGLCQEWGYNSLIWVCVKEAGSTEPVFYSHVGKIDRFHHSSFTAGGEVIGAGEWIVDQGRLKKISANSGHYRPPITYLHRAVLYMAHAWQHDTVVLVWNSQKDNYEEVPILTFRNNPTNGGIWKSNPAG